MYTKLKKNKLHIWMRKTNQTQNGSKLHFKRTIFMQFGPHLNKNKRPGVCFPTVW